MPTTYPQDHNKGTLLLLNSPFLPIFLQLAQNTQFAPLHSNQRIWIYLLILPTLTPNGWGIANCEKQKFEVNS